MTETPTSEPEPRAQGIGPLALTLRDSATRGVLLVLSVAAVETFVRTVTFAAHFPDLGAAALELATRTARLLVLAPAVTGLDLALTAASRARALGEPLTRRATFTLQVLHAPAAVVRAALLYAVSTLALTKTLALDYQLRWHAGALFALGALPVWAALELGFAKLRGKSLAKRPNLAGGLLWLVLLGVAASSLTSAADAPVLGPALALVAMTLFGRGPLRVPPWRGRVLGLIASLALVGLWLDSTHAALRRFASARAPFSALALRGLQELTDFDGDGSSGPFGLDCDDLDPTRSPAFVDLPDDGSDQNCTGKDGNLQLTTATLGPTSPRAQRSDRAAPKDRPAVILLTVDGLRGDWFEDGSALPQTRRFVERCHRFTNAHANANSTGESLLSLHTGMSARHVQDGDAWRVALADPKNKLLSTPPTLASLLDGAGYSTLVVFPPFHLHNFAFLTGYARGGTLPNTGDGSFPSLSVSLERARAQMRETPTSEPLHLRIHLMDLHVPYRGGEGQSGYLRTARDMDAELLAFLQELPESALIVLTADHGEAFGEHGTTNHGHSLFEEELHVPLVLCAPPGFDLGPPRAIDTLVGLVDVLPTLMDLLGLPHAYPWHGQSLVDHLRSGRPLPRPWVFAERWSSERRTQTLLTGCQKWIEDLDAGWRARFDLCADPHETRDLGTPGSEATGQLLGSVVDTELDAIRSWRVGRTSTQ